MAADLVKLRVDLIVAAGQLAVGAARKATSTIPIVMGGGVGDPVSSGFVKSLPRPGGNITGMSLNTTDVSTKQLEMLLAVSPKLTRVALLVNPVNRSHATILKDVQAAAQRVKVRILPLETRTPQDIERAFATMAREKVGAVFVSGDGLYGRQERQIAELAIKLRLPSAAGVRERVEAGFLLSYGPDFFEQFRRSASYVDKIFKGAKPGEIPVEQPTTFEFVINRKTAKALGLTIPQTLLLQATEVIE